MGKTDSKLPLPGATELHLPFFKKRKTEVNWMIMTMAQYHKNLNIRAKYMPLEGRIKY